MRQVVLDTETTGLDAESGHRIVEVACVELCSRQFTGRILHRYLDPERDIDEGALAVHGLSRERLQGEAHFGEIARELLEFVDRAEVLIHNAPFDLAFLRAEFARAGQADALAQWKVNDTLVLARSLYPGKRNSLDALCDRHGVSRTQRTLHGALLDARLLAEVYLAMTRGQESLDMLAAIDPLAQGADASAEAWPPAGLRRAACAPETLAAHAKYHAGMVKDAKGPSLWSRLQALH
jgi:DNA polymerase-3 subunit epsilon